MYYKLMNRTILTSALVSLICVSVNQSFAQEISVNDDEIDISLPNPDKPVIVLEEENIPLDNAGIIAPEKKKVSEPSSDETKTDEAIVVFNQEAPEKLSSEKQQNNDDFDTSFGNTLPEPASQVEKQSPHTSEQVDYNPLNDKPDNLSGKETGNAIDIQSFGDMNPPQDPQKPIANANPVVNQPQNVPQQANPLNNMPIQNQPATNPLLPMQNAPQVADLKFGDAVLAQTNNDLFNQMSDIEKQTTLLTLELKRERIRNEVEAAKAVREKAKLEKLAMEEEKKRREFEWKKEQEAKVIREQVALKQKEIELEKLKQRKALTAYMNSMLEQKQSWIDENAKLYQEINNLKQTNQSLRTSYKKDLNTIALETEKVLKDAETAKSNYERTVATLTAQNVQLKKRIEANTNAAKYGGQDGTNTISTSADALIKPMNIAKEYAIMDITGKGDELFVKLINKQGDSFVAKTGTVLQTGHMIEEITPNYVQFDRNGLKDFLYTATAPLMSEQKKLTDPDVPEVQPEPTLQNAVISDDSMPSLGDSMFVK